MKKAPSDEGAVSGKAADWGRDMPLLSEIENNPWKRFKIFIFAIGFCPKQ